MRIFGQFLSYSPRNLLSQTATISERAVQGCRWAKHKTYSLLDDHWVILSTSKAFFFIFEQEKTKSLRLWPSLVCKLNHRTRPVEIFLQKHILETIFHQILTKAQRSTRTTFQMFSKLVIYATQCQSFWSDFNIFRMEIQNASTTSRKSNQMRHVNQTWLIE